MAWQSQISLPTPQLCPGWRQVVRILDTRDPLTCVVTRSQRCNQDPFDASLNQEICHRSLSAFVFSMVASGAQNHSDGIGPDSSVSSSRSSKYLSHHQHHSSFTLYSTKRKRLWRVPYAIAMSKTANPGSLFSSGVLAGYKLLHTAVMAGKPERTIFGDRLAGYKY